MGRIVVAVLIGVLVAVAARNGLSFYQDRQADARAAGYHAGFAAGSKSAVTVPIPAGVVDSLCQETRISCLSSEVVAGPFDTVYSSVPQRLWFVLTRHDSPKDPGTTITWGWTVYVDASGAYLGAE